MNRIYFVFAVASLLGWYTGGIAGDNYRLNREIKKCLVHPHAPHGNSESDD